MPNQLYSLTIRELFRKIAGFYQIEEQRARTQYEAARATATFVMRQFSDKEISPIDLGRFSWEEPIKKRKTDPDLYNRRIKEFENRKN